MKKYLSVFVVLLLSGCISAKNTADLYTTREETALGTFISITIEKTPQFTQTQDSAFSKIKRLEEQFSVYISDSEISRLNKNKEIKASEDLLSVFKKSIHISRITGGAFDITTLPLTKLYREAEKSDTPPPEEKIKEVLKDIGYEKIRITENIIKIPSNMEVDVGGIAKGYVVDRVAEYLQREGVRNGLVNAGGDMYCFGKNSAGTKWRVAINNPFRKGEILQTLYVSGYGIATSGNYERYLSIQGKKFGHIINPFTGKTLQDIPASVTVIAPDTTTADGLATAFFVLGIEKSLTLADELQDIAVFIVNADGKIYKNQRLSQFLIP